MYMGTNNNDVTYYTYISGTTTTWNINATIDHGYTIVFGVEAVFNNPLEYSDYMQAGYLCSAGNMIYQPALSKTIE